ncbi:MAG: hypothetical protein WC812_04095 [Candidatus Pacearchaeota archaeon]|jgi:hypothetical protein
MNNLSINTPILLIAFNRPDLVKKVFEEIKKAKPKKLFVSVDGPRNNEEKIKVDEVKKIVSNVDWPCKLNKRFQDKNLGIIGGALGAIDWFFENVEEGIILEDDAIPNQDFFKFCSELLKKYRNDEKIMQINGCNFQRGWKREKYSYYFSKYAHTYGWATWRRARRKYDSKMQFYLELKKKKYFSDIFPNKIERKYILHIMDDAYFKIPEAIDTRWVYSVLINDGLCITPNENLVQNIGFGKDATHTKKSDSFFSIPTNNLSFPLIHPQFIIRDRLSDERYAKWLFKNRVKKFIIKRFSFSLKHKK